MKLLAIDTSAEACSVAIMIDDKIYTRDIVTTNRHTELVLPLLDELRVETQLTLRDLDGIAFGAGPGAFTGVRVAASVAHGIALAYGCPLIPVSSLAALALGGWRHTKITTQLAVLDARRGEVYWGLYQVSGETHQVTPIVADTVQAPQEIPLIMHSSWCAVGRGWEVYVAALHERLQPTVVATEHCRYPSAGDIALLAAIELREGRGRAASDALPIYLRAPV